MSDATFVTAEFAEEHENLNRSFGKKVMGEDGRYIIPVKFDGVEVDFRPGVFEDFRFMMAASRLNDVDEEDTSPENMMEVLGIQRELFTLMFGKKQAKKILNKLADSHGGILDVQTFFDFNSLLQKAASEAGVEVKN